MMVTVVSIVTVQYMTAGRCCSRIQIYFFFNLGFSSGDSEYKPSLWPLLSHSNCGGEHQSPINIVTKSTVIDEHLDAFIFTKFDDKHAIDTIVNTGHTGLTLLVTSLFFKRYLKCRTTQRGGGGLHIEMSVSAINTCLRSHSTPSQV